MEKRRQIGHNIFSLVVLASVWSSSDKGVGDVDFDRANWGNLSSNIDFLEKTRVLDTARRILEIGCGQCQLMLKLKKDGHEVTAIDAEREVVAAAPTELDVRLADGSDLPFADNSFEVVLSFDVIEHIPDTNAHLAEVRRVLKPGGYYLLQTPNKWTNIPFEMVRWSTRYGVRRMFDFLKPPQHCSLHSYWQLKRRMRDNGFTIRFYDIPVVNEYFVDKVQTYLGKTGAAVLKVANPDKLPLPLRTNFYVKLQPVSK